MFVPWDHWCAEPSLSFSLITPWYPSVRLTLAECPTRKGHPLDRQRDPGARPSLRYHRRQPRLPAPTSPAMSHPHLRIPDCMTIPVLYPSSHHHPTPSTETLPGGTIRGTCCPRHRHRRGTQMTLSDRRPTAPTAHMRFLLRPWTWTVWMVGWTISGSFPRRGKESGPWRGGEGRAVEEQESTKHRHPPPRDTLPPLPPDRASTSTSKIRRRSHRRCRSSTTSNPVLPKHRSTHHHHHLPARRQHGTTPAPYASPPRPPRSSPPAATLPAAPASSPPSRSPRGARGPWGTAGTRCSRNAPCVAR